MAEEVKVDETTNKTTQQNATVEPVEPTEVDYEAELEKVQKEEAEKNKFGYAARKAREDLKKEETMADTTDDIANKVLEKILPAIKSTSESSIFETKLEKIAGGNEALKKLITYHYENSTNPNLDMDSRLNVALSAANQKTIDKKAKEINIAQTNRSQIANHGQGSGSTTTEHVVEGTFSKEQLAQLEAYSSRLDLIYAGQPERAKRAKARYMTLVRKRLGA